MEEESTSEGSQNPLLGFLFGNLDEGNRVDADYLDDVSDGGSRALTLVAGQPVLKPWPVTMSFSHFLL